jgi:hypothetical protein
MKKKRKRQADPDVFIHVISFYYSTVVRTYVGSDNEQTKKKANTKEGGAAVHTHGCRDASYMLRARMMVWVPGCHAWIY